MKKILFVLPVLFAMACNEHHNDPAKAGINILAQQYVRLGLAIGAYDSDFVDAYYGPDSLKPITAKAAVFPKDSFLNAVNDLVIKLHPFCADASADTAYIRAKWMTGQLTAFARRIRIFSGETAAFDTESKDLFGVVAPTNTEEHFKSLLGKIDSLLPGKGSLNERFQVLAKNFIIPKDKIDTVFKTAIAESRKRTRAHYSLPADEHFSLEFLTNKPWSGYNWYKGNYSSLIQINTDLQIFIERAIDVASHESYPGHHVYNMLLEKNLYHDKGWVEVSLYPLYSPQSLIAEGSANFGIEVAFPGKDKIEFAKNVLLPLAGLDTTGIDLYFRALALKGELGMARNEAARGLINNTMDEKEVLRWITTYGLSDEESALKSISFIKKYRSYVINYNYGMQLVKQYIEARGRKADAPEKRWEAFGTLLSNEILPAELIESQ